jgi:hypothetical protein
MGEWSRAAVEDLTSLRYDVADELVEVARTSLDHHYLPDGDESPPYFIRRGIRVNARRPLTPAQKEAYEYVLVYERKSRIMRRPDYLILAVYKNTKLADALVSYLGLK